MYRFLIAGEEWILRFSPHLIMEEDLKKVIADLIVQMEQQLQLFTHGESFMVIGEWIGAIVFNIEKIPSLILTVSNIVSKENWYTFNNENMVPLKINRLEQ